MLDDDDDDVIDYYLETVCSSPDYCYEQLWGIIKNNGRSSAKQLSNCPMIGNDICYNSHSPIRTFQNRSNLKVIVTLNQTNY